MVVLASVSASITDWIAQNGVYAVFALMAIDALFPAGGEWIILAVVRRLRTRGDSSSVASARVAEEPSD